MLINYFLLKQAKANVRPAAWQKVAVVKQQMPQVARITRDILPHKPGRVRYLATEWNARSIDNSVILAGANVKPIMRSGNTWWVAVETKVAAG